MLPCSDGERQVVLVAASIAGGIPVDLRRRVLEPLFSTKSFGVGLGLSIVKAIMEEHRGGVRIENRAEPGTTVTLWLPLVES